MWDKKKKKILRPIWFATAMRPGQVGGQLWHCFADCTVSCKQVSFWKRRIPDQTNELWLKLNILGARARAAFFVFPLMVQPFESVGLIKQLWGESKKKIPACYPPKTGHDWLDVGFCKYFRADCSNFACSGVRVRSLEFWWSCCAPAWSRPLKLHPGSFSRLKL